MKKRKRILAWILVVTLLCGQMPSQVFAQEVQPIKIVSDENTESIVEVSLGYSHSAAITENGDLYLWGDNTYGQLGNGTNEDSNIPIKIMNNVEKVSLGYFHSAAITKNGDLYLWGHNSHGELGNGKRNEDSNIPIRIMSNMRGESW